MLFYSMSVQIHPACTETPKYQEGVLPTGRNIGLQYWAVSLLGLLRETKGLDFDHTQEGHC